MLKRQLALPQHQPLPWMIECKDRELKPEKLNKMMRKKQLNQSP
jgi:hypothetical protein